MGPCKASWQGLRCLEADESQGRVCARPRTPAAGGQDAPPDLALRGLARQARRPPAPQPPSAARLNKEPPPTTRSLQPGCGHSPETATPLQLPGNHILRITHQLHLSACQKCHRALGSLGASS